MVTPDWVIQSVAAERLLDSSDFLLPAVRARRLGATAGGPGLAQLWGRSKTAGRAQKATTPRAGHHMGYTRDGQEVRAPPTFHSESETSPPQLQMLSGLSPPDGLGGAAPEHTGGASSLRGKSSREDPDFVRSYF